MLLEALALALAVAIHLGMPVAILFILGFLAYRNEHLVRLQPVGPFPRGGPAREESRPAPAPRRVAGRGGESRPCPAQERDAPPAGRDPEVPCWQSVRRSLGRLHDDCLECDRFLASPPGGSASRE